MKKTKADRFFELFAGECIQIILDKDLESTEQSEDSVSINKSPLSAVGFLVEEDDVFYYLSLDPLSNLISSAICKDFVVHVQLFEPEEDSEPVGLAPDKGKWN